MEGLGPDPNDSTEQLCVSPSPVLLVLGGLGVRVGGLPVLFTALVRGGLFLRSGLTSQTLTELKFGVPKSWEQPFSLEAALKAARS